MKSEKPLNDEPVLSGKDVAPYPKEVFFKKNEIGKQHRFIKLCCAPDLSEKLVYKVRLNSKRYKVRPVYGFVQPYGKGAKVLVSVRQDCSNRSGWQYTGKKERITIIYAPIPEKKKNMCPSKVWNKQIAGCSPSHNTQKKISVPIGIDQTTIEAPKPAPEQIKAIPSARSKPVKPTVSGEESGDDSETSSVTESESEEDVTMSKSSASTISSHQSTNSSWPSPLKISVTIKPNSIISNWVDTKGKKATKEPE